MDDALCMCGRERVRNLRRDRQDSSTAMAPRAMRSPSVGPSTSSITSAIVPPVRSMP